MRHFLPFVASALLTSTLSAAAPIPKKAVVDAHRQKVMRAISRGRGYLISKVKDGGWEHETPFRGSYPGGATSLVVVALLKTGMSPDHRVIQEALQYLRTVEPGRTYSVGLQTMAFVLAGRKVDKAHIERNLRWLEQFCSEDGWGYSGKGSSDHSINHYALMGIHAAMKAGYEFDKAKLKQLHHYYCEVAPKGEYGYRGNSAPMLTMTAAGLWNLSMTRRAGQIRSQILNGKAGIVKPGKPRKKDDRAQRNGALDFMGRTFPGALTPDELDTLAFREAYYCLDLLMQVGQITGRRRFGLKDWYRIGCECLLEAQHKDGSWQSNAKRNYGDLVNTCFALTFLSHGQVPVLITKLAFGEEDDWNRTSDDVANLVSVASRELFKGAPLGWEILQVGDRNLNAAEIKAEVERLQRCPIVYLTGRNLKFSKTELAILKGYVQSGGTIIAESQEQKIGFRIAIHNLVVGMGGRLRPMPEENRQLINSSRFKLHGMKKNGREVVILNDGPTLLSGFWNFNSFPTQLGQTARSKGLQLIQNATGGRLPKAWLDPLK